MRPTKQYRIADLRVRLDREQIDIQHLVDPYHRHADRYRPTGRANRVHLTNAVDRLPAWTPQREICFGRGRTGISAERKDVGDAAPSRIAIIRGGTMRSVRIMGVWRISHLPSPWLAR